MPDFLKFPDLDQLGNAEKANRLEIFLDSTKNVKFDQFMIDLLNEALWSSREKSSAKYKDLILDLSSYISHANGIEPSYHNQNHFKDVCLSMTLLLRAQTEIVPLLAQSSPWKFSDQEAWILLLCAVCHDLGHDGSVNKHPFDLEKKSVELVQNFLEKSSLTLFEGKEIISAIEPIILATDPRYLPTLLDKIISEDNLQRSDYLSMLMIEADLLASALEALKMSRNNKLDNGLSLARSGVRSTSRTLGSSGIGWMSGGIGRRLDGRISNLSGKPTKIKPPADATA